MAQRPEREHIEIMRDAFICDFARTPIGRYGGSLSKVRTDDLAAIPLKALIERNKSVDWSALDEVFFGCANQAGEDNRNVARMALLLAGIPEKVPGVTLNRLCASGLDAVGTAARAIKTGELDFVIAGGVESMSRAPFVQGKATEAFSRTAGNLRHDDRLALRQSADEEAIWRRFHARDRRKRRRGISGFA
jgi:3-oxoadipyl-CoA thiolase